MDPTQTPATPVNPKTLWYRAHKCPELRERMNASRRAYYQRNKELEKTKALARYYAKKEAAASVQVQLDSEETPAAPEFT